MSPLVELAPFALLGLAGSLHCVGMCGPFAVSLGWSRARASGLWARAGLYVVGKSLAYSMIAVGIASTAALATSRGLARSPQGLAIARSVLAWIAGAMMIGMALRSFGLLRIPHRFEPRSLQRILGWVMRSVRGLPAPAASFGLGLANGFLPCGLSWAAIALAVAGEPWVHAIGPLVFGLATAPALVGLAIGSVAVPMRWRVRAQYLSAALLLVFGAWTIGRGHLFVPAALADARPECCTEPGETAR